MYADNAPPTSGDHYSLPIVTVLSCTAEVLCIVDNKAR